MKGNRRPAQYRYAGRVFKLLRLMRICIHLNRKCSSAHCSANDGLVLFRGIFKRKADKPVMSYSLSQENCEGEGEGFARREARAGAFSLHAHLYSRPGRALLFPIGKNNHSINR